MKKFKLLAILLLFTSITFAQKTEIIKLQGDNTLLITNDTIVSIYGKYDKIKYDVIVHFAKENPCDKDEIVTYSNNKYAILYQPKNKIEIRLDGKRDVFYVANN